MSDVREDDIFNKENIRRSLRFTNLKAHHPRGGVGTLASFEAEIPGLLTIRDCRLRRRAGEPIRLTTARIDGADGFAVETQPWLHYAIRTGAVRTLREKCGIDLALLENDTAKDDTPPIVPDLDAASLPAQLMREVRVGA